MQKYKYMGIKCNFSSNLKITVCSVKSYSREENSWNIEATVLNDFRASDKILVWICKSLENREFWKFNFFRFEQISISDILWDTDEYSDLKYLSVPFYRWQELIIHWQIWSLSFTRSLEFTSNYILVQSKRFLEGNFTHKFFDNFNNFRAKLSNLPTFQINTSFLCHCPLEIIWYKARFTTLMTTTFW